MNDQQQQEFEAKFDERMARGFLFTGKNAIAKFREYLQTYIDQHNGGRVSASVFEIIEKAMVASGELRPMVLDEEPELTLQEYRSMPVRQIQLKYRNDPVFKAGVEKLIANGLI